MVKWLAKLLYWKLAVPNFVSILPPAVHVASGPFRGMRYVRTAHGSAHSAKVLGTYERELRDCVTLAMTMPFKCLVNIGAGEGYYAIGLGRALHSQIVAFEAEAHGRGLIAQLADWNGVSVSIRGLCGIDELNDALASTGPAFVVCDVEGYEAELLDPQRVDALASAWVLVELHETLRPGVSALIVERFKRTHQILEIASEPRRWKDFPGRRSWAALLPKSLAFRAMEESRAEQSWFWMQPLSALR